MKNVKTNCEAGVFCFFFIVQCFKYRWELVIRRQNENLKLYERAQTFTKMLISPHLDAIWTHYSEVEISCLPLIPGKSMGLKSCRSFDHHLQFDYYFCAILEIPGSTVDGGLIGVTTKTRSVTYCMLNSNYSIGIKWDIWALNCWSCSVVVYSCNKAWGTSGAHAAADRCRMRTGRSSWTSSLWSHTA